jgi:hypothetical protein
MHGGDMNPFKFVADALVNLVTVPPSLYHELSPDYETKMIDADGRSPNQVAEAEGGGWQAGWVDYDSGQVEVWRKKP